MKLYDPQPFQNGYLSFKFLLPLLNYGKVIGKDINQIQSLNGLKNETIILHGEHLNPELISRLKNDNNIIVSFDINDSTWLFAQYGYDQSAKAIDLIFKWAGNQITRTSMEVQIDKNIQYSEREATFIPDPVHRDIYETIRDSGRLQPMPHAPFYHVDVEERPWDKRIKKALVRGGAHYLRYHLFLNLMKHNLVDISSGFFLQPYMNRNVDENHRFCDDCCSYFEKYKMISYQHYKDHFYSKCSNKDINWINPETDHTNTFQNHLTHRWNNKCIPMFYWLTEKFNENHGNCIDFKIVESALNKPYLGEQSAMNLISQYMFYGDYKWNFSVDIPPRFWQGANCGTINILPDWTVDQEHFPELIENEHYLPFGVPFTELDKLHDITKEQFEHIANNAKKVYDEWIKPGIFQNSEKMLNFIFDRIEGIK
jgi:hypothetical protein